MARQVLRKALRDVTKGHDPQNIVRDEAANQAIATHSWNTVTVANGVI